MSETLPPPIQDDTVSLIDILAVLLRHRRLIVSITVIVTLAAIVALYVLPALGLSQRYQSPSRVVRGSQSRAVARVQVQALPEIAHQYFASTADADSVELLATTTWLMAQVTARLDDLNTIAAAWRPFAERHPETAPPDTPEAYLVAVQRDVVPLLEVESDATTGIITVSYRAGRPEDASQFVDTLLEGAIDAVAAQIGPSLAQVERTTRDALDRSTTMVERLIAQIPSSGAPGSNQTLQSTVVPMLDELVELQAARAVIDSFAQNPAALYARIGTTAVEPKSGNRWNRSTLVIAVFAVTLVFAIFCAFVLEYVRRVKAQPSELEKLRSAWRRS